MISVTVSSDPSETLPYWRELTRTAEPNVFMAPQAIEAAQATGFSDIRMLLAWDGEASARKMVGFWALRLRSIALWPAVLEGLPHSYAFLSNPVTDPACAEAVAAALLATIRASRSLPRVLRLRSLDTETAGAAALRAALASRGGSTLMLAQECRPVASRIEGVKSSGSTRKKMRQDWNRLAALGQVEVTNRRDAADVAQDFEVFLGLEQAGWKGTQRTAILSSVADAAFSRLMIGNLASSGAASVALLTLNGTPLAAQVIMYCGTTAYTWKTAYDEAYGRYSPGALLVGRITDELLASREVERLDSCAAESSFMAQLWTGRRLMADLLIDVGPGRSLAFHAEAWRLRGYYLLRRLRDDWRRRGARRSAVAVAQAAAGAPPQTSG
jgi:CelD/BcsL family acetyltransferase involved in cellulose biosynthesis